MTDAPDTLTLAAIEARYALDHGWQAWCAACGLRLPTGTETASDCPRCGENAAVSTSDEARRYGDWREREDGGVL